MKTIRNVTQTALCGWNLSVCLVLALGPELKQKSLKIKTIKLVRAVPQDPKVLGDFTRFVSMFFSYLVADYRSFMFLHTLMKVSACKVDIICNAQSTLKVPMK